MRSIFSKKKIMIFAPHQDDEINLAGGLIPSLIECDAEVKVVYSTNGDFITKPSTRYKECIKSLSVLGVEKENIIFLGYSDQYSEGVDHLYNTLGNKKWISNKKYSKTYHPIDKKELAIVYDNCHHIFNRENFIKDIIYAIESEKPDFIISIDFDSHADHRALSLSVEYAIGIIMNKHNDYRPTVYKTFAYPTFYFGINDLDSINIESTKFKTEKNSYCEMQNPYYLWDSRIRFPLKKESYTKRIVFNKVFKAMNSHKSQCFVRRAFSTINGDQIFWQRRTDNLLNESTITVSSGEKDKLHDFMLFECKKVMNGNSERPIIFSDSWIPNMNDETPIINVQFKDEKIIDTINFYHQVENDGFISQIEISDNNKYCKVFDLVKNKNNISTINLDGLKTNTIKIKILNRTNQNAGLSELEIFEKKIQKIKFIKLEIAGNFAYNYFYSNEKFKVYSYDGVQSRYLNDSEYEIISDDVIISHNSFILKKTKNHIRIQLKSNNDIYDEIILYKSIITFKISNNILNILNHTIIWLLYKKQLLIRKIKRLLKIN